MSKLNIQNVKVKQIQYTHSTDQKIATQKIVNLNTLAIGSNLPDAAADAGAPGLPPRRPPGCRSPMMTPGKTRWHCSRNRPGGKWVLS